MELLLNILVDLALLVSIALLVCGMVLCAILGMGEGRRDRLAGERRSTMAPRLLPRQQPE